MDSRKDSRLQAYVQQTRFSAHKTLQAFDFSAIPTLQKQRIVHLAGGDFIRDKENVICMGASGTSKTHIAIAIGVAAISVGYRMRFITVMLLVQKLLQAESEYWLPRYLRTWDKYDLVCAINQLAASQKRRRHHRTSGERAGYDTLGSGTWRSFTVS